jgi:hypothetical protein
MRRNLESRTGAVALLFAAAAIARADDLAIFNTGVDGGGAVLPVGTNDPHWQLIAIPSGIAGFPVPRQAVVAAAHPAYIQNSPVGSSGSSWIALRSVTDGFYPPGDYVYRTTFDMAGLDPATAQIDGNFAADDGVVEVFVNGAPTGIHGGVFNAFLAPFSITSGFHDGVNSIDFLVRNGGGSANPSGFRAIISGQAKPKKPSDQTPPALIGVTDRSFSWTGSPVSLSASTLGITAVDDVDGPVPVSLSPTTAALGNTLVTASASDAAGNTATATFTVHVLDTTAPVISGPTPAQPTFDWHGAVIPLSPALVGVSAVDDVSGPVAVTLNPASVGFGDTFVTARAQDAAANVSTKTFTVHVVDVTAPVITGPTPSQPTFAWHGSAVSLTASLLGLAATDDVNGAVAVVVTPSSAGLGDTLVTASASDAAGNHSSKTFIVHVVDATPPVISGPAPATPTFGWHGAPIAVSAATLGLSATDDVDGAIPVDVTPSSVGLGDTPVTASATDAAGNHASKTFTVRVVDVTAPVVSGPTTSTFGWHGAPIAVSAASLGLSAMDDVDGAVAVNVTPSSVGLGDTSVTASASDAAGNHASKTFTVHVVDVTAPVIYGPTPATPTFEWRGSAIALSASVLGLSATDDVDGAVAVAVTPTSAGLGDTTVTACSVDAAGNAATKTFTVHVADTTAPTIASLAASPNSLDDRNHKMVDVVVTASVSDAGDAAPSVRIVSIACIDGNASTGPSTSSADWAITGNLTAQVRAERSGQGSGRTYVITVQATDASGNVSTATVNVFVAHDSRSH